MERRVRGEGARISSSAKARPAARARRLRVGVSNPSRPVDTGPGGGRGGCERKGWDIIHREWAASTAPGRSGAAAVVGLGAAAERRMAPSITIAVPCEARTSARAPRRGGR
jgi:hypothetical protein